MKLVSGALGFKFDLAIESFTLTSGPRGPRVVISQKHVQTGSQIGLLGKAIYNVDFNLSLQPSTNRDEPLFWWGSMDLDWYHPNGGHNGQTIGDVRYLPYETDYIDMRNVKGVFQIKA